MFISKYNSHSYKFLKFYENNATSNKNLPLLLSYDQNNNHYQLLTYTNITHLDNYNKEIYEKVILLI